MISLQLKGRIPLHQHVTQQVGIFEEGNLVTLYDSVSLKFEIYKILRSSNKFGKVFHENNIQLPFFSEISSNVHLIMSVYFNIYKHCMIIEFDPDQEYFIVKQRYSIFPNPQFKLACNYGYDFHLQTNNLRIRNLRHEQKVEKELKNIKDFSLTKYQGNPILVTYDDQGKKFFNLIPNFQAFELNHKQLKWCFLKYRQNQPKICQLQIHILKGVNRFRIIKNKLIWIRTNLKLLRSLKMNRKINQEGETQYLINSCKIQNAQKKYFEHTVYDIVTAKQTPIKIIAKTNKLFFQNSTNELIIERFRHKELRVYQVKYNNFKS